MAFLTPNQDMNTPLSTPYKYMNADFNFFENDQKEEKQNTLSI